LGGDGRFHQEALDSQGVFRSEAFPGFWFNTNWLTNWLWQDPLPSVEDINLQESAGYSRVYGKGKQEGIREGKQDDARKFLALRFGEQSTDVQEVVKDLSDVDILNDVLWGLYSANSLDEVREVVHRGVRNQQSRQLPITEVTDMR
jgi:hypothetical protein